MARRVRSSLLFLLSTLLAVALNWSAGPASALAAGDAPALRQRPRTPLLAATRFSAATADIDAEESLTLNNYFLAQNYSGITLRHGPGNHLEVMAKINDRTGIFLIDTGAQITVVNRGSLNKFGLTAVKTSVRVYGALGGPGEKIEAALASAIQLGPCTVSPFLLGVSDLGTLNSGRRGRDARFDGIIGADLLQNFSFIIDCRTPRLYAKDVRTSDGASIAEVAHPGLSQLLRGRDYVEVSMKKVAISDFEINANVNRRRAVLLIDTGAAITLFDRALSREAGIDFRRTDYVVGGAGGGRQRIAVGMVNNLQINGLRMRQTQIAIGDVSGLSAQLQERGHTPLDGYLGADFLRQKSAVIDCAGLKLYLKN